MEKMYRDFYIPGLLVASLFLINAGCQKTMDDSTVSNQNVAETRENNLNPFGNFRQIVLNANTIGYNAPRINPKLHNAWGMSESSDGTFLVSAADGGVSFVYSNTGAPRIPAVIIPSHIPGIPGNPTGNVFNATGDFIIKGSNNSARFLFAGEDGTISGWNGGAFATIVINHANKGAGYTGLTIANNGFTNYLYAANFAKHTIDVFDKDFKPVSGMPFKDPDIPEDYAPFNIREINHMLYVTYALVGKDGEDSTGAGLGFVDVYWPNGLLSRRLDGKGYLNAPWGIVKATPALIGMTAILIGNFGDGHISVFDWDGNFRGQLMAKGQPVAIEGLWAIDTDIAKTSPRQLYFTAGPKNEEDGNFGFLFKL